MKILMTGATGTLGNEVGRHLVLQGHDLIVITRSKLQAKENLEFPAQIIEHDLVNQVLPKEVYQNIEAVIHLMGETVDGRWTSEKKKRIYNSRVQASQNLIQNMPNTVNVVISASAQGIYKPHAEAYLSETAEVESPGSDFLSDVCLKWEAPFVSLKDQFSENKKFRSVQLRISLILDHQSGVLQKLIPLCQRGLGGALGSGSHYMSWIALCDMAQIVVESLTNEKYKGPINCSSPEPVTNKDFMKILCQSLGERVGSSVPEIALKVALGEMSQIVLKSYRYRPEFLLQQEFKFKYQNLQDFCEHELQDFRDKKGVLFVKQYIPHGLKSVFDFFSEAENLEKITPSMLSFKIEKITPPVAPQVGTVKDQLNETSSSHEVRPSVQSTDSIVQGAGLIMQGTIIDYRLKIHGVPAKWKTLIDEWQPPFKFVDTQLKGPYRLWHHTHCFSELNSVVQGEGTLMTDRVRYQLPLGGLGHFVASDFVRSDVESIFSYRRKVISQLTFKENKLQIKE